MDEFDVAEYRQLQRLERRLASREYLDPRDPETLSDEELEALAELRDRMENL